MIRMSEYPLLIFLISFVAMYYSARFGNYLRKKLVDPKGKEPDNQSFNFVVSATLTLLGLIIGFTFSMATERYDLRKSLESEEANAIGTEYVRADLLPAEEAAKIHALLIDYLDQRILFYTTRDSDELVQIHDRTAVLQAGLWSTILPVAAEKPNPIIGLTVSGMNDVLNAQGYTQAAWWNRIPRAAWILMLIIAICSNMLIGYSNREINLAGHRLRILPFIIAVSFFLIADIDSPRWGVISVTPDNLSSLAQSLHRK